MKYLKLFVLLMTMGIVLCACSNNETSKQTRTDLTKEHFEGLTSDMKRSDIEDLVGKSDTALAENESFEMYSLTDGTTAVLRYSGEKLQSAYIRGKDMIERPIFDNFRDGGSNVINDGTTGEDNNDESTDSSSEETGGSGDTNNTTGESGSSMSGDEGSSSGDNGTDGTGMESESMDGAF